MKADSTKLKIAIARTGMTKTELAKKAGITDVTIRKAERGEEVNGSTLGRLAKALEVDITEIMDRR